jgi:chromosome segregation ATPase
MEGTEGQASTTSTDTSASIGKDGYHVTEAQLAEMGVDLSEDSGEGDVEASQPTGYRELSVAPKLTKSKPGDKAIDTDMESLVEDVDSEPSLDEEMLASDETSDEANESSEEPVIELERFGKIKKVTLSQAKALAQKGFSFEEKSTELNQERTQFEQEKEKFLGEFQGFQQQHEQLKAEKEQYEDFFEFLKDSDEDTYSRVEMLAKQFKKQNKPNLMLQKQLAEMKQEIQRLSKPVGENQELAGIRANYYSELADLRQMHSQKYAKFGIKMDEKAIQSRWEQLGGPLEDIYHTLYGKQIATLSASKAHVAMKAKSQTKAPTFGKVKAGRPTQDLNKKIKNMSWNQLGRVAAGELRI